MSAVAVDQDPWRAVEALLERAPSVDRLRLHGVELIAAELWERGGRPVPAELRDQARWAAIETMAVPLLLRRMREAYPGKLMLFKGPELAAHYPSPEMRPFRDLDLLVDDALAAQAALIDAGFVEVGDPAEYEGAHHLRPLVWPKLEIPIELHHQVNHAAWLKPPPTAELLELTEPSATGAPGVLAPIRAAHAVLIVAHSWAHEPLRRLLDLIDVAVLLGPEDRSRATELARRWGLERMWRISLDAMDVLLRGAHGSLSSRIWGRHLAGVRERSVLETHLALWAGRACALPGSRTRAIRAATAAVTGAAHPKDEERWSEALRRTTLAVADALHPQSQHNQVRRVRFKR